jgi:hypothetical protein
MQKFGKIFEAVKWVGLKLMKVPGQMVRNVKQKRIALWLAVILAAVAWLRGRPEK